MYLLLNDIAKNAKAEQAADVQEVPEDIARPHLLAASLSGGGDAIICDEESPADAGSKRATCGSGGTAAAPTTSLAKRPTLDEPRSAQASTDLPPLFTLTDAKPNAVFTTRVPDVYVFVIG